MREGGEAFGGACGSCSGLGTCASLAGAGWQEEEEEEEEKEADASDFLTFLSQPRSSSATAVVYSWLVFYRSRCVPFFPRQAQDALLFGWYGPEGQVCYVVEAALVADIDSGIVLAGFAGFALCFPSLSSGPGCAASCAVWTRRTGLLRDSGFLVEPLVSGSHVQCLPRRRQT